MLIAIHQPNYFPWTGYFYKIMKAEYFIFLDDAQYTKNSFINRTNIIDNKKKVWMSIPVKNKFRYKINQTMVADREWKKKHLSKIKNSYKESIFFKELWIRVNDLLESIKSNYISDINKEIIIAISSWLNFETKFYNSSSLEINNDLKSEERLIEIIKYFKCNSYLSGQGGKKYQDEKKFSFKEINLLYSTPLNMPYKQNTSNFITGLSILDPLFNLGLESTLKYINNSFESSCKN